VSGVIINKKTMVKQMKKTVIIAINSKYIHSSLAPWYLKAACGQKFGEIKIMEFTINDRVNNIFSSIYQEKPDVAAFSCYIWNIEFVMKIADDLKKALPDIRIILGGPEVSFETVQLMQDNQYIDFILKGEGEISFKLLLNNIYNGQPDLKDIKGLTYRMDDDCISDGDYELINDLDSLNSPYTDEMLNSLNGRIAYFESSRGCPFSCSYCISSTFNGVRYFSLDRVFNELAKFVKYGVKQVKFVDRTFNCNKQRAKSIISWIIENGGNVNFHFEAAADLFDDEMLNLLETVPEGMIQLEIGIQTLNNDALNAIDRKTNLKKVFENIKKLMGFGNINIHVDLIAGLPKEDLQSFINSFNKVFILYPHQLQLGFLKLLKGSKIKREEKLYSYIYHEYPPYEIISNKFINADEIMYLKDIEELVEAYWNSLRFTKTLKFLIGNYFNTPFDFFEKLADYYNKKGLFKRSLSGREKFTVLMDFIQPYIEKNDLIIINELMKFDFLSADNTNNLPKGIVRRIEAGFREKCFEFLKDEKNIKKYLPQYKDFKPKEIIKSVHFESFDIRFGINSEDIAVSENKMLVLFDYNSKSRVTGRYRTAEIDW